jgi:hypothetical protein
MADLGHHSIKAGARDAACRRAPEIVIDRFNARPAQRRQTIAHRILQGAALAIVENLMGGGLPYIQDRLSLQMMRLDLLRLSGFSCWIGQLAIQQSLELWNRRGGYVRLRERSYLGSVAYSAGINRCIVYSTSVARAPRDTTDGYISNRPRTSGSRKSSHCTCVSTSRI